MNYSKSLRQPSTNIANPDRSPFLSFAGEGTFYALKKNGVEILFNSAKVTFTASKIKYLYSMKIENAQNRTARAADKENVMSEYVFKISENLNLTTNYARRPGEETVVVFEWQDNHKTTYGFEFGKKKRDGAAASNFKELLCKLIYQTKYKIDVTDRTPLTHYLCFCQAKDDNIAYKKPSVAEKKPTTSEATTNPLAFQDNVGSDRKKVKSEAVSAKVEKMEVENEGGQTLLKPTENPVTPALETRGLNSSQKSTTTWSVSQSPQTEAQGPPICKKGLVYLKVGDLYQLDDSYNFIKMQESALFCVRILKRVGYQLEIYNLRNNLLYYQPIDEHGSYFVDLEGELFKWTDLQDQTLRVLGFKLSYDSKVGLEELKELLTVTPNWDDIESDSSRREETSSITSTPRFSRAYSRVDEESRYGSIMEGTFEEEKTDRQIEMSMSASEQYFEEEEDEGILQFNKIYKYFEPASSSVEDNVKSTISQSKLLNRTFVCRGPSISVFRAQDSLEFICNLPNLRNLENELIQPKKLLFYQNDTKMIVLNQELDKKVHLLDLERGSIVNEWMLDGYNNILDIEHLMKNGELSYNDQFLGINSKNVFLFDPNQSSAPIHMKNYNSNPKFACFATTAQGYFATGSLNGDIRLYKETGKNAKNLIGGCGEAILGIESTKDGSILAATTENSILLYRTNIDGTNGYLASIKKFNNEPIQLTLPSELVENLGLQNCGFSKAKFDNVYQRNEQYLVSSVGRILLVWRLADVFSGVTVPKIFDMRSEILDCEFTNDRDDSIFVVLQDQVNYIKI